MILPAKLLKQSQVSRATLLVFLLVLVSFGAIPSYFTGRWPWVNPPPVVQLKQLRNLRTTGLRIPGWQHRLYRNNVQIGGHKWLVQEILSDRPPIQVAAFLLLLPQNGPKDKPQVEWMDINGFHQWQTDSDRNLRFTVDLATPREPQSPIAVEALFFRGWNQKGTFAVLEWYAWPHGGSPVPSHWFWQDRIAQLSNQRVPWVAVSLLIPIPPLSDIERARPLATSLGQAIQASLIANLSSKKGVAGVAGVAGGKES